MNLLQQLQIKPWFSPLQLGLGGLMIFFLALYLGPYYGCGPGNQSASGNAFSCATGSMSMECKVAIVACIAFASLCWGRAMSLLERAGA